MSFGNILGQLMNSGLRGGQSQNRVDTGMNSLGGGQLGGLLGQLQGALGGGQGGGLGGGQGGGFADRARDFARQESIGGMSNAKIGGIGAAAGALFGGGLGGAARGGALAVLGSLALGALKNAQAKNAGTEPGAGADTLTLEPHEIASVTGPDAERLMVRAMIAAAKADGQIDQTEMQKIIGKIGDDDVTADEKSFVLAELGTPLDIDGLARAADGPAQAAEVYAASLIAIDIDTDAERDYLRRLAQTLRLDAATVEQLHQMTGAPKV